MVKKYEWYLHRLAATIGGYAAMYTILIRSNLGSSQTLNIMEVLKGLLGKDFLSAFLHFLGVIFYGGAVFFATVLTKKGKVDMRLLSMIINMIGFVVLGFLPENVSPVIGLYPTFIMMSIQWVVYGNLCGYASSPIFSTNNLRQTMAALAEYSIDHDRKHLDKAKFFAGTILFFHIGAAVSYFVCEKFSVRASFFGVIPCMAVCAVIIADKLHAPARTGLLEILRGHTV